MKNNEKLKELSNIIKNARKFSLIGEYGNSLEKYQEAISIIKERQKEIINESEDLKEKWKMTEYNIKSEMLQIKNVLETCLQLHHSHFNYSKKQLEGDEYLKENKKKLEKEILEFYNKEKHIYEPKKNNNKINRSNKSNKDKNKVYKIKLNLAADTKKNKTPKISPWVNNKNYINYKNNKINNNDNYDNNINIKKCKSLKVNTIEKKMFNPLEEFYSAKIDKNNNEIKINGNDNSSMRKSELIHQKLNLQKSIPSSYNKNENKISINNNNNININNDNKKKIKVVQIDLDDDIGDKKIFNDNNYDIQNNYNNEKKEENYDMVEQALKNLSQLNIDNNDDSF